MEFGMPVLAEVKGLEETASLCSELGLDFIEINMNYPWCGIDALEKKNEFDRVARKYGLYYTIHMDENFHVSDFTKSVSDTYMEIAKRTIVLAAKIQAPVINFHMSEGAHMFLPDKKIYLFERYQGYYLEKLIRFRELCEREIGNSDISMCIENTDGYRDFQRKGIRELLKSPVFSLTWDIGHSYVGGNVDERFLMIHQKRLKHFHIHDAAGTDSHLALGTGEVNLEQRLELAKKNHCRCVVGAKNVKVLRQSVLWLEGNWDKIEV